MALDRPYPRSRWSVLPEVGCLCSFVDASLRIGACCCILKGVDTSAGTEVTKFGTAKADGEALIERQTATALYQESHPALQADGPHQDARPASQADRLRRVLRRGVVSPGYLPNTHVITTAVRLPKDLEYRTGLIPHCSCPSFILILRLGSTSAASTASWALPRRRCRSACSG